jgi:hypothetical protein
MLPNNQRNFSDQFRALVGAVTAQYNAVSLQEFRNSSISFKSKSSPPRSQFETVNIAATDLTQELDTRMSKRSNYAMKP